MEDGRGSNGGIWEWTSTVFDTHEGLVPTKLFTGYSEDFFDTKHQVVVCLLRHKSPCNVSSNLINSSEHRMPRYLVSVDVQCAISISTIILTRGSVDESYMTCRTFSNFFHLMMYIPVFPTHNEFPLRRENHH